MKLSKAVSELIRLGEASHAYWDRELPKRHPHYPVIRAGEGSVPPPPEDAQIQALLRNLSEDQIYALVLLTYVGRGDYSADHLQLGYQAVREAFPTKELAIAQMTGSNTLAEYLADAMQELDSHHIDLDSLHFAGTVAVS
ncbi:MAG TPA: DUF3775 domain-containing protein [Tepidisphaeraceae bacterium]|nr:DUF3775 domain-containing protein [Tepidisphaeraceae bacterium]